MSPNPDKLTLHDKVVDLLQRQPWLTSTQMSGRLNAPRTSIAVVLAQLRRASRAQRRGANPDVQWALKDPNV